MGPRVRHYPKPCKHDDVIIVPGFGCEENDWSLYYKLVEEMRSLQDSGQKRSEWIPWNEGCHLISKNPKNCPTYEAIVNKMCEYFKIVQTRKVKTRFNWYRDSSDWKPFHHDCAAYSMKMSRHQNVTVGISFGDTREIAFLNKAKTRLYIKQKNGMLFHFGRDVNINWQHAVNALPKDEQTGKGRISIIVWGWVRNCVEEPGSPQIRNDPFKQEDFEKEETKVMTTESALSALKESVHAGQYLSK